MADKPTKVPSSPYESPDHSDYLMLISLKLDGMLDPQEKVRLDRHLEQCNQCRTQSLLWQVIDQRLHAAPVPELAPNFSHQVAARIARQERQRNLQVGLVLTVLTVLVWALGLVGACSLVGALIYTNMGSFAATGQFLAEAWAVAGVVGQSLWEVILETASTSTTLGIASVYLVIVVGALAVWCIFIQRTTQPVRSRL